jgi:hypothetical protein
VGPVTALATEVFLGDPSRFAGGNKVASYRTTRIVPANRNLT